jgi:4-amino-4-deoxy-L-arabinose transferase-like glycosyltransferase
MRRILIAVFCVAFLARAGYGVVRYHAVLGATDREFVSIWDHDGLEHVLIAQGILAGHGHAMVPAPEGAGKHMRTAGTPALFKAPLYQYFLAGLFKIFGLTLLPLLVTQALLGAILSCLVVLVTIDALGRTTGGLYAGLAASLHPVLVNSASQPYNENLFFLLFILTVWLFLRWLNEPSLRSAALCGVAAGLAALTRESILAPFAAMLGFAFVLTWRTLGARSLLHIGAMLAGLALTIAPWTYSNYLRLGVVVPISTISGSVFGAGNNECTAQASLSTPFYGDAPCRSLDRRRMALQAQMPREPLYYWSNRAYTQLGLGFVTEQPLQYFRLCVRRAWTALLPYHPRQYLGTGQKLVLTVFLVGVVVVGALSAAGSLLRGPSRTEAFLIVVALATYVPLVLIFVSHDLRFRVGLDLILACFAGRAWSRMLPEPSTLRRLFFERGAIVGMPERTR